MLDWGNGGICTDGVNPWHVAYGVEGVRECWLQGICDLGCCCDWVSCLTQAGVGVVGFQGP